MTAARSSTRTGAKTLAGSDPARRGAAIILEVLSGGCGAVEGSQRLGVSLTRYYALETRALQALVQALEPRPRGRARPPDPMAARREQQRLEGEVLRLQALVRALQRAVAVAPPAKDGARRRRKAASRARKVIAQLRPPAAEPSVS